MSRSLDEAHLVITEEQYKALQRKQLFIQEDGIELSLVDFGEYYTERAAYFFEYIASHVKHDTSYLEQLKSQLDTLYNDGIDLFEFFNQKTIEDKRGSVPVSLEEWLEFDDGDIDYYIERYITEEQIGNTKFYLLILIRFW